MCRRPDRSPCKSNWACTLVVCICALFASRARADVCAIASIAPDSNDPARAFAQARDYAQQGDYAKARAMYRWLLVRKPQDRDAALALARVDAWDDCFVQAEQRYRALLHDQPSDIEARVGLIDVLFWSERWDEAGRELEIGFSFTPQAAELWQRRARWLQWSGERPAAAAAAEHAQALAPDDPDIRMLRDRLFPGQARASLRIDAFPHAYPNLYTADIQALQYWKRFDLGVDAQLISRIGGSEAKPVVDGLYTASGAYHAKAGTAAGLSVGFGAPAHAIPAFTVRGWLSVQVASRWSGYLAYSFWQYHNYKSAHIIAPTIGYALNDNVQLELRWWSSFLVLDPPTHSAMTSPAHAGGGRVMWRILTPWILGISYTYGRQLDQSPANYEFLRFNSHVLGAFADWTVARDWGVSPSLGFERRKASSSGAVVLIYSAEMASYIRW
jgi:tetratricopeptide (TPR) repeat protein